MTASLCTKREYALALQVALDNPNNWPDTCVAWVDSKDATCGKPRTDGLLCNRHVTVADRRFIHAAAKAATEREAAATERARDLPGWRAELAKIEARMRVLDPPNVNTDPAAYVGNVHPSIRRKRATFMSDTRVQEMGRLVRRAEELRRRIGTEGETS